MCVSCRSAFGCDDGIQWGGCNRGKGSDLMVGAVDALCVSWNLVGECSALLLVSVFRGDGKNE
jgi:hypothetical protein